MRRMLPRTLLRPLTHPLRHVAPVAPRRFASTESAQPTTVPLLSVIGGGAGAGPSTIHPTAASIIRTMPQKVKRRRQEHPSHPRLSVTPLSDPELFDLEKNKRMPLKMEKAFLVYRGMGLFPGDEAIARTHYLDASAKWRSRIRGTVSKYWSSKQRKWIDVTKRQFLLSHALERGIKQEDTTIKDAPMDVYDLVFSARIPLEPTDIIPEKAQELDPTRNVDDLIDDIIHVPYDPEQVQNFDKDLVDWEAVQQRVDAMEESEIDTSRVKEDFVANRIYLPETVVRFVRNHTPVEEAYDPWVATFRIPPSMTKTDLRSYLKAVYDMDITFIRTDLYWGKVVRDNTTGQLGRQQGKFYNYKRAVVGLTQPFHYPDDEQEQRALGREKGVGDKFYNTRLQVLENAFFLQRQAEDRKQKIKELYKRALRYRKDSGNMGVTIKKILARRVAREEAIKQTAVKYRSDASFAAQGIDKADVREAVEDAMRQ